MKNSRPLQKKANKAYTKASYSEQKIGTCSSKGCLKPMKNEVSWPSLFPSYNTRQLRNENLLQIPSEFYLNFLF